MTQNAYVAFAVHFAIAVSTMCKWVQQARDTDIGMSAPEEGGWYLPVDIGLLHRLVREHPAILRLLPLCPHDFNPIETTLAPIEKRIHAVVSRTTWTPRPTVQRGRRGVRPRRSQNPFAHAGSELQ